jgi:predicted enzyme related to lactoylglutathione lyase
MARKARLVGINHVALEVGDLDDALEFYGRIFDVQVESRIPGMAFITMGDQFLALAEGRTQAPDDDRHFGLVVDDKEAALAAARDAGVEMFGKGNDFRDPWGNFVQIVEYSEIQFTKAPEVLHGMDLDGIGKSERARDELRRKGLV